MSTPLISICIPAYKRVEIFKKTIESIYKSAENIEHNLFEVVVSDNDDDQELKPIVESFKYDNLSYFYSKCKGFLNSYFALSYGKGQFLKLHNSQACFEPDTLKNMLDLIKLQMKNRPMMLFSNGQLKNFRIKSYCTFDEFMYASSYYTSWSNGIGIWKEDFDTLPSQMTLNEMFPHTSVIMNMDEKKSFLIDDRELFYMQKIVKKGGHNMFKSFSIDYTSFIENKYHQGRISHKTYQKIKDDLVKRFFPHLYFKTKIVKIDTYESDGFRDNLRKYYPRSAYYKILIFAYLYPITYYLRKWNL